MDWWGWLIIYPNTTKSAIFHREDGPAYINYFLTGEIESEQYYQNNVYHRIDGPAFIGYDRDGTILRERYYLLNYLVSKEDFETPGFIDSFIVEHS